MKNQLYLFELPDSQSQASSTVPPPKEFKRKIKTACRNQIEFKIESLDKSIPQNHQVRTIWSFINLLDFSAIYEKYSTLEGGAGRALVDPKILVSLWVYAICDKVISARKIAQYCLENKAYAWLCGGIGVSHHLLSGFRSDFSDLFDRFVVQSIEILYRKDLISIKEVAQDGVKKHASASSASMRRKKSLIRKAINVRKHIRILEKQLQNGSLEREEKQRKKRELVEAQKKSEKLVQAAQEVNKHKETLNKNRVKNGKKKLSNKEVSNLRASSTDPECRKMKMADKSFKPAYNVQIATHVGSDLVLKTQISQSSFDGGQLLSMYSLLKSTYKTDIEKYLVDSAYRNKEHFQAMYEDGCLTYSPSTKKNTASLRKRILSREGKKDTPADKEWIKRMETEEAKEIYNRRIRVSETINAFFTNHGIHQLIVRGIKKVKGFMDLACLAYNIMTIKRLYNII